MILIALFCIFLCWGSFLNVVAYRLAHDKYFLRERSHCPCCDSMISWYDNVPLISWIILGGRCRSCRQPISLLYPFIELTTALSLTQLALTKLPMLNYLELPTLFEFFSTGFAGYLIFVSALIVCTRTDFEIMMVPQLCTLWLVPVAIGLSSMGWTDTTWQTSTLGALCGYAALWIINRIFKLLSGKEGIGEGDMDMMALIGSFLGPWGSWIALLIGSTAGSVIGSTYLWWMGKGHETRIPFGPLLALGAIIFLLYQNQISWIWS